MITTVFFDLDGTLLPMEMEEFTNGYFKYLVKMAAPYGYEPDKLIKTVWGGTKAMVMNDGKITNEEAFWKYFCSVYGEESFKDKEIFDKYYATEFNKAKDFCGFNKEASETVEYVKNKGLRTVLATNPLFPEVATRARMDWAGIKPEDFEFFTTYENCNYCKPNTEYYKYLLEKTGVKPEEVLMVGNDATEDLVASKLGISVFLITDCLINKDNVDISTIPQGTFSDLRAYLDKK